MNWKFWKQKPQAPKPEPRKPREWKIPLEAVEEIHRINDEWTNAIRGSRSCGLLKFRFWSAVYKALPELLEVDGLITVEKSDFFPGLKIVEQFKEPK